MASYATKKDVQEVVGRAVGRTVDDISVIIQDFATQVDQRFVGLEERVNLGFDKVGVSIDKLINTIDGFVKRLDDMETENTARNAHLARLDRWIHDIADKTGVKLQT